MGHPNVAPLPAPLDGYPNAMPSLHVATALLLVLYTGRNRLLMSVALLFLAGTVAATLAFEHYVVDLLVAVPLACFAVELADGRAIPAVKYLGVVLAWLGLIRFASPWLVQHPSALRFLALLSVTLGIRAVAVRCRRPRKANTTALDSALADTLSDSPLTASPSSSQDRLRVIVVPLKSASRTLQSATVNKRTHNHE
jgi:hypothetical protein